MLFSVITPTWNRAAYLPRVFESLLLQSCHDFEWIISDDGSTDATHSFVLQASLQTSFKIIYIQSTHHVGKPTVDNRAIQVASGILSIWCDSDDWLVPYALEDLKAEWLGLSDSDRKEYSGLTALAATCNGATVDPSLFEGISTISWNDLVLSKKVKHDMVFCSRTELLKQYPFPEVDLCIPESSVWAQIGHRPSKYVGKVLLMKEYLCQDAISFVPLMKYNRGYAYSLAITSGLLTSARPGLLAKLFNLVKFLRYSINGELPIKEALNMWPSRNFFIEALALPASFILSCRDRLLGKVVLTHNEFTMNRYAASFQVKCFYPTQQL
jgi:glycosyltransferase involved in cell wall biosynthesis